MQQGITKLHLPSHDADLIMKMRLNYDDPKERRIIEALASCGQRDMSRFLKRMAYQLATGLDYDTDLPIQTHAMPSRADDEVPAPKNPETERMLSILADL